MFSLNCEEDKLKRQLSLYMDDIVKIISKGSTVEIRQNNDGVLVLEVSKKKISKKF